MSLLCLSCVGAAEGDNSTGELETAPTSDLSSDGSDLDDQVFLVLDNDADKENIHIGDEVTWEISVVNLAEATAKNVKVHNQLPDGLAYVSHTTTKGTFNPETGIWDIGDLNPDDGEVFLHIVTKALTLGEKVNKAYVTTDSINLNENSSYEEEEIDVEIDDDDSASKSAVPIVTTPSLGNPLFLILISFVAIFTTCFTKSRK